MNRFTRKLNKRLKYFGLQLQPANQPKKQILPDQPEWVREIVAKVKPYTMTSPERISSLCQAVEHVVRNNIPGEIVECGVWRGGSMMAVAYTLQHLGKLDTQLHLFDTFEGMPEPTSADVKHETGESAVDVLLAISKDPKGWSTPSLAEVRENMASTGYPSDKISFVCGKVQDTVPDQAPRNIALLRLDTDWYESTLHEMTHMYPRLSKNGILIVDDYGHWDGARKAIDEYITGHQLPLFLARVDYTGRVCVKP